MAGLSKPELTPPKELAWRGSSPEDNTAKSCWGCFGDPPPSDRLPQNQAVWDAKLLLPHKSCLSVYDMVAGFPWRARRNYNSFYELVSKVTRHHFWFILCAASESLSPTYAREEELSFSSWREQNQRIWGHTLKQAPGRESILSVKGECLGLWTSRLKRKRSQPVSEEEEGLFLTKLQLQVLKSDRLRMERGQSHQREEEHFADGCAGPPGRWWTKPDGLSDPDGRQLFV